MNNFPDNSGGKSSSGHNNASGSKSSKSAAGNQPLYSSGIVGLGDNSGHSSSGYAMVGSNVNAAQGILQSSGKMNSNYNNAA